MKTAHPQPAAPPLADAVTLALQKGLNYLQEHQFPNGEWCCFMSGDDPMQGWTHQETMLFPTMLVVDCLQHLPQSAELEKMCKQAGWFLRYHMERAGVWGHCGRSHAYYNVFPLDVDDTCCIGACLKTLGIDYPEENSRRLVLANQNGQGLFYSWFCFRWRWHPLRTYWRLALREFLTPVKSYIFWSRMECGRYDVDAVVNANVLWYFGDNAATKNIAPFLLQILAEKREVDCDKWYRHPLSVYYFMSRCLAKGIASMEPARQPIVARTLALVNGDGSIGASALDTAVAMCVLQNLAYSGPELERAARYLLQAQQHAGNWPRWRFYYGGPKMKSGYGSEELTTAFCLQALGRYQKLTS